MSADKAPTSMEELNARTKCNYRLEGYGFDTTVILPCVFCGAADWVRWCLGDVAVNGYAKLMQPTGCEECGRVAQLIFGNQSGASIMEIVQTDGPEPPEWLKPRPRRLA